VASVSGYLRAHDIVLDWAGHTAKEGRMNPIYAPNRPAIAKERAMPVHRPIQHEQMDGDATHGECSQAHRQ
jgi:hypothetical protein